MATTMVPVDAADPYDDSAALVWVDADVAGGVLFTVTGREVVLFRDANSAGLTATVVGTAVSGSGRITDTTVTIPPGTAYQVIEAWGLSKIDGFGDTNTQINISRLANLEVAVLRLQK